VDDTLRQRLATLSDRIRTALLTVEALDENEQPRGDELAAAHRQVAEITTEYKAVFDGLPEGERFQVERSHGRRVTDLRRAAGQLPQQASGQAVAAARDDSFVPRRDPPRSMEYDQRSAYRRGAPEYQVGREVEAWCGPCGGLTDHTIAAIVDGQPKQVICQACNSRHGYRLTPARGKAEEPKAAPSKPTAEQLEARRKQDERFALGRELAEATDVRRFTPRARYKLGEIIDHPEYGRGKIEHVLRDSVLIRFRDALRSLMLQ
jgi:hypothetical protein